MGYLLVWPHNSIRHNEDVMSIGGVCDISHQIGEKVSDIIYVLAPLRHVLKS